MIKSKRPLASRLHLRSVSKKPFGAFACATLCILLGFTLLYADGGHNNQPFNPQQIPEIVTIVVPGGIVTDTLWTKINSPYRVTGTITIPDTSSLTIEPGVEVIFQGNYQFIVKGKIIAVGGPAAGDSIIFRAANPDTGWGGLRLDTAEVTSKLEYCRFQDGWAKGTFPNNCGGAVYVFGSVNSISHCSFYNNRADFDGGAVYLWNATPNFSYNLFTQNEAGHGNGHAVYAGNSAGLIFKHATIAGNENPGPSRTGYSLYLASSPVSMTLQMENSILWDSYYFQINSNTDIDYSCMDSTFDAAELTSLGNENFIADPLFADEYLHLTSISPCIDAASPFAPYSGELPPNGGRANQGAYGNSIGAATSIPVFSLSSSEVELEPDTLFTYGKLKIFLGETKNINIYNLGHWPLSIYETLFTDNQFTDNSANLANPDSGFVVIQPSGNIQLQITFTPESIDTILADLTFNTNDPADSDAVVHLRGIGVDPIPVVTPPDNMIFPTIVVGDTMRQNLAIQNAGNNGTQGILSTLIIERIYGTDNFYVVHRDSLTTILNDQIQVGQTHNYHVVFDPSGQGYFPNDTLQILTNAGDIYIKVEGGGSQPQLAWNPDSLQFGVVTIGTTNILSFDVWNTGDVDLVLEDFHMPDRFSYIPPSQYNIPQYDTLTIQVVFSPNAEATFSGLMRIETNMPGGEEVWVTCIGVGTNRDVYWIGEISDMSNVTAWTKDDSPYYIVGDIWIPADQILTIEDGIEVYCEGDYEIVVYGTLIADGTPENPIEFTTWDAAETWSGITFKTGSTPSSFLDNCIFHRTRTVGDTSLIGAAVRVEQAAPLITNCEFYNNKAYRGGAIGLLAWSHATIRNCYFHHDSTFATTANQYSHGGAIYMDWFADSNVDSCEFRFNYAAKGGAIFISGADGSISNCLIDSNYATSMGGGIYLQSGAGTDLSDNDIRYNIVGSSTTAGYGGGVAMFGGCMPTMYNERIYYNTAVADNTANAGGKGGGLYIQDGCTPDILKTLIVENTAVTGQAVYTINSGCQINYCTFADSNNSLADGWLFTATEGDQSTISNSIIWGANWTPDSTYYPLKIEGSPIVVTFSDIVDSAIYSGLNNINADPLFIGTGATIGDAYQLNVSSPCLTGSDAGAEIGFNGGSSELLDWTIVLELLQNPVSQNHMHFILNSKYQLTSPPYVYITQDLPDTLGYTPADSGSMAPILMDNKNYSYPLYLEQVGSPVIVTISLRNQFEADSLLTQDFIAANLTAGGSVITFGPYVTASAKSPGQPTIWGILPEYYSELKFLNPELLAIGQAYDIFAAIPELRDGRIEFSLNGEILEGRVEEGCAIARWNEVEARWDILPSYLTGDKNTVWAALGETGTYRLVWSENNNQTVLLPSEVCLFQNYPNPFNPETVIEFALPDAGQVKLDIFNLMGQKVITLADGFRGPGFHQVHWSGVNAQGAPSASGVYFYRLQAGNHIISKKMILLR